MAQAIVTALVNFSDQGITMGNNGSWVYLGTIIPPGTVGNGCYATVPPFLPGNFMTVNWGENLKEAIAIWQNGNSIYWFPAVDGQSPTEENGTLLYTLVDGNSYNFVLSVSGTGNSLTPVLTFVLSAPPL